MSPRRAALIETGQSFRERASVANRSVHGVVLQVLANAPTSCTTTNAVRITALLNAIAVHDGHQRSSSE